MDQHTQMQIVASLQQIAQSLANIEHELSRIRRNGIG
jgi:hypothetical protein